MAIKTGLERIVLGLRGLSWVWAALVVGLALTGALGDRENTIVIAGLGLLPSGIGFLVAWIIDGFAKKEG